MASTLGGGPGERAHEAGAGTQLRIKEQLDPEPLSCLEAAEDGNRQSHDDRKSEGCKPPQPRPARGPQQDTPAQA